jgi:hypothetical protein
MRVLVVAIAFLLAALVPAWADLGGFEIDRFDVDLEVQPDASVVVTERLEVVFSEPRHGIYRVIPTRYTDPWGYEYGLGFELLDVRDDRGAAHESKLSREGHRVKIRIGSAEREVSGHVVYVIRYLARDAARHFAERDELYWNATGTEWDATIRETTVTIRLPGQVADGDVELAGYTGRRGDREQAVEIERTGPAAFTFRSTRQLSAREGLTVAIRWPHGMVAFPGPAVRAWRFARANWIVLAPVVAFFALLRAWRVRGRDLPGPESVVVRYEPPEDLRPAELGTIVDEKVDLRDITSTLVDLAVRGYLKIEVTQEKQLLGLISSDEIVFHKLEGKDVSALRPWERTVLDGIFQAGNVRVEASELEQRFYTEIPEIRRGLYERLTAAGYFAGNPDGVRTRYALFGLLAAIVVGGAGLLNANVVGAVMPQGLFLPLLSAVATLVLFLVFSRVMPQRTRKGVEARAWALGFEEFIDRVEAERLEQDRRRNVFESLLPYAMALGVAARWARKFEGIYAAGGQTPAWYVGAWNPHTGFTTRSFVRSLGSTIGKAAAAMTEAPRSSGSSGFSGGGGGGGFSGGGGGGGGGGSW